MFLDTTENKVLPINYQYINIIYSNGYQNNSIMTWALRGLNFHLRNYISFEEVQDKDKEEHSDELQSPYPSDEKIHHISSSSIRNSINLKQHNRFADKLFHVGSGRHLDSDCGSYHRNERDSSNESEAENSDNKHNLLSQRQTNMYSLFMINDTIKHQAASSMLSISESFKQKDSDSLFHQKVTQKPMCTIM